jgi:alpha-1,2-glucosyltransferase
LSQRAPGSAEPRHDRGSAFLGNEKVADETPQRDLSPTWVLVLGVLLGTLYASGIAISLRGGPRGDELYHYAQIHLFREGDFRVLDYYLTTIPGYHAGVALLLKLAALDSLGAARVVTALFGLLAIAGFHALRRIAWPGTQTLATAQLMVLPILVPLFFLVYTDVLALALILWAAVATLHRRHWLSAMALCAVVLVRQNDVVWAAFLALVALRPQWRTRDWTSSPALAVRALPYLVPLAVFAVFWAWNGSISLSHTQAALHPQLTVHAGNVFFALFLAGALLPLQTLQGVGEFARSARRQPWLVLLPVVVFALYWWTFRADNPYNSALPDFYPRNAFVLALDSDWTWRAGAGLVMTLAACGLAQTKLRPSGAGWLYPFAAIFLMSSWLIEQRYALVPLTLWLAFRQQRRCAVESVTLALWLFLAVWVFWGIATGRFFL